MDINTTKNVRQQTQAQSESPCNSSRRPDIGSKSPEFEFWMARNPSSTNQNIVSADELFVNGVLLPLDTLSKTQLQSKTPSEFVSRTDLSSEFESTSLSSTSKRWRDIFKKSEKKHKESKKKDGQDKKNEKKNQMGTSNITTTAELNINIWPFSRSRSAGNSITRPKSGSTRKVRSAPCSRSNSAGESRKWPSSPGRAGVHLGRSSPVWQVRRGNGLKNLSSGSECVGNNGLKKDRKGGKVLNLKLPMCGGLKHGLSSLGVVNSAACSRDVKTGCAPGTSGGNVSGDGHFHIRSLFSKKVH